MIFFNRAARFAQVGDELFKGSIGRTDFPRGNHDDLINAITTKLWPLGDDVRFVPSFIAGERTTFLAFGDVVAQGVEVDDDVEVSSDRRSAA